MSVAIMAKVWRMECRTHTQKLVLLAIADNADDNGRCWPGIDHLATKCSLSRQGVIDQINGLVEAGVLTVKKSQGISNIYTVQPVNAVDQLPVNAVDPSTRLTRQRRGLPPVNAVDYHPSTPLTPPVNAVDPNHQEPSYNHQDNHQDNHQEIARSSRFVPPTIDEVSLCMEKAGQPSPRDEAEKFVCYYASIGWLVGKKKMKSWPHSVGSWVARNRTKGTNGPGSYGKPRVFSLEGPDAEHMMRQPPIPDHLDPIYNTDDIFPPLPGEK